MEGKTCRLRPLRASDASESIGWRNDAQTRRDALGYAFPVTEVMERAWYDRLLADQAGKRVSFAIEDAGDAALVGFVHLTDIDWISRTADFGITIGRKDRRGKGIGAEATRLILGYAFDTLNLERVGLRYIEDNGAAARIYGQIGFVVEGRLRSAAFADGKRHDVVICGLLRKEWAASAGSAAVAPAKAS
jgi:RimJ/RimL family protein N-acetyltransferase